MAKSQLEQQLRELDQLKRRGVITGEEYETRRAVVLASANDPAPARGGGGGKGFFKWSAFGCLGILGLLVVVAIAGAVAGSGDDEGGSSGATGTPGAVGTNKGDVHVALEAGASGEIAPDGNPGKRVKVTIIQVADGVKSSNQFERPAEGKKWWGVEVVVQNVGTKEVTALDWKLRDTNDGEHSTALVFSAGEHLQALYDLTPGGKTQGWVYFEIPEAASAKWLRADPNMFLKNDLYFDAK
ncbi:MAG: DUF4352 domain-containing protein [Dehalococcoidia bacterium]|nr:DUF4352 domain-containing protein [Dehalococcoidia bacterium]NUQ56021.1 DUF4352 domain-containing protein [Dehalococcoidia bacterium]